MTEWGIDTLFNPGKRHMDEEKRRLQSTREEIGDSSGGRRIDLESGTVKISRKGTATPGEDVEAGNEAAEVESARDEVETVTAAESVDQTARSDASDAETTDEEPASSKPGE